MEEFSYPQKKFGSAKEWHLYYIYNDDEFKSDTARLKNKYKKLARELDKTSQKSNSIFPDWFQLTFDEQWDEIKTKYCINSVDIAYYLKGLHQQSYINANIDENMGLVYVDKKEHAIKLFLAPFVTYDRYLQLWKDVQKAKLQFNERRKRKPPKYPDLIYAIFKARLNKKTYKEIFDMHKEGNLPFYSGSGFFDTKEDLKTYYNKHRPNI